MSGLIEIYKSRPVVEILSSANAGGGGGGGGGTWGSITGTLSDQTDLQTALDGKWGLAGTSLITAQTLIDNGGTHDIDIGDISTGLYYEATSGFLHMIGPFSQLSMGDGDDANGGLVFTDSRTTKQGIKYAAAGYVTDDRSLTDKGYVESLTGVGGAWKLLSGGTLTGANTIVGTTTNTITYKFDNLGTTQTNGAGHWLTNTTAAAAGAQQISPSTVWEGQGWKTNATAASQSVKFAAYVTPVQGTANPFAQLNFVYSINGAAYQTHWGLESQKSSGSTIIGAGFVNSTTARTYLSASHYIDSNSGTGNFDFNTNGNGHGYRWFQNGGYTVGSGTLYMQITANTGNLLIGSSSANARLYVVQSALSSAWLPVFRSDPGAHTALTSATEFISRDFQGATWTWIDGTTTVQRFNWFRGYTLNKTTTSASFPAAYNVWIEKLTAGSGVTISSNYGLGVEGNIAIGTGTVGRPSLSFGAEGAANGQGSGIYYTANILNFAAASTAVATIGYYGSSFTQNALASLWQPAITSTPGAHTALTTATEFISRDFRGASQTWIDGTVTTQRFNYFKGYTLNKTTTSATFTNPYTVYIEDNTAGAGVTLTNNWALGLSGNQQLIGSTPKVQIEASSAANLFNMGFIIGSTGLGVEYGGIRVNPSTGEVRNRFGGSGFFWTIYDAATSSSEVFRMAGGGRATFTQRAMSSLWGPAITSIAGAHTGLTAATEFISRDFQGASQTWIDGTVATQRFNYFKGYTANKTTTSATFTDIYNVYIEPTTAGAGVTLTNNWALGVAGNTIITGLASIAAWVQIGTLSGNVGRIDLNGSTGQLITAVTGSYLDIGHIGSLGIGGYDHAGTNSTTSSGSGYDVWVGALGAGGTSTAVGELKLRGGISGVTAVAGGAISIISGAATVGNANSGNIFLDLGAKVGSGTVGNIGLFSTNTDFDGGEKVLRIGTRTTAPSGSIVADHAYLYVQDIAAGNAAVHTMTELGDILKLYAVGGWGTPTNTFDRTTFDTTTVTLAQLAARVGALISDLKTLHGLLKA